MAGKRDRDRRLIAEASPWSVYRDIYGSCELLADDSHGEKERYVSALAREANRIAREVKRRERRGR